MASVGLLTLMELVACATAPKFTLFSGSFICAEIFMGEYTSQSHSSLWSVFKSIVSRLNCMVWFSDDA